LPATWQGKSYTAAAVADPAACPPASLDGSNAVCDHFRLTVGVDSGYWSSAAGGASVTVNWADSANDFDLYVYDAAGN
jgi:alpha-glucosidase